MARKPAVAVLLSSIVPGLGQMYNGELAKGAVYLALVCVAAVLLSFLAPRSFNSLMTAVLILLALWIVTIVDAGATARAMSAPFVPRSYNTAWAYTAAAVIVLFGVQGLVGALISRISVDIFEVKTPAMAPTLLPGDYVVAKKGFHSRERVRLGTIIPFVWRAQDAQNVVRRVVGVSGDTLAMKGKTLFVNGWQANEPYVEHIDAEDAYTPQEYEWQRRYLVPGSDTTSYNPTRDNWGPIVVANSSMFVLADNREAAEDSRTRGFVSAADAYGKVRYVLFSLDRAKHVRAGRTGKPVR